MEDLEEKIQTILSDPQQLQSILSFAQSLGISPPPQPLENTASEPPQPSSAEADGNANAEFSAILSQVSHMDRRQEALLLALKPFLKPSRRQKIDRAVQAARFSHLAGLALRRSREQPQKEEPYV